MRKGTNIQRKLFKHHYIIHAYMYTILRIIHNGEISQSDEFTNLKDPRASLGTIVNKLCVDPCRCCLQLFLVVHAAQSLRTLLIVKQSVRGIPKQLTKTKKIMIQICGKQHNSIHKKRCSFNTRSLLKSSHVPFSVPSTHLSKQMAHTAADSL